MIGSHAICNGRVIPATEAVVPVSSREVQHGFTTYESLSVVGGRPIHLEDHLQRLENSCQGIGLIHPFKAEVIQAWLMALIEVDGIEDATVRIQLYGGPSPLLFILASKILTYPDSYYTAGVKAITWEGERLIPSCKTGNLLLNYMALEGAKRQGCFEALLVDRHGFLLEGTRSNFYAFEGTTLYTAADDLVLQGITRETVIRVAKQLGFTVVYQAPSLSDLKAGRFDELFISATSMAAMPLARIDEVDYSGSFERTLAIGERVRRVQSRL
jgi:branched-chain amino acid aminotransferase